jgi:DNA-binding transcriptional ArsR family regulator
LTPPAFGLAHASEADGMMAALDAVPSTPPTPMLRRPASKLSMAERMRGHADDAARLLRTLGNDKRLLILCLLSEGERSVGELNVHLDLSQSALSQHLAVLREDGLVRTRRDAQTILYSLVDGPSQRVIATLHEIYCPDTPKGGRERR